VETRLEPAEERIVLSNIRWETYESLLADLSDCSAPRHTYDEGALEIMSPFAQHEEANHILARLVDVVAEEWDVHTHPLGCTTFKRADLACGFDPDSCFYVREAERMRGRDCIDLTVDPPPELVIEININCWALPKFPIHARFGVPEVWRYDGDVLSILTLEGGVYHESEESLVLPALDRATLSAFLQGGIRVRRTEWVPKLRDWAQTHKR
jgi:Uma2 family endonuclease